MRRVDASRLQPHRGHRRWTAVACAAVGLMAVSGLAHACTAVVQAPIIVDRDRPGYSDSIRMIWDDGTNVSFNGCPNTAPLELTVDLQGAGLRWVMDFDFTAWPVDGPLPLYETGPSSALIGFGFFGDTLRPLRLGPNTIHFGAGPGNAVPMLFVLSRGSRMEDFQTNVSMQLSAPLYPSLAGTVPISIDMRFPPTTCRMQDVSEVLQDVSIAELRDPGDTAREKPVSLLMDCGIVIPRADIVLTDTHDPGNTGSVLTPTSDSTAEGVAVQLLSGGSEVQLGRPWFFNPGGGGVHTFEYTARYIRLADDLKPGLIKGEAVLNVDYW